MNTTSQVNATKNKGFSRRTIYRVAMEGAVKMPTWDGMTEKSAKVVRCIADKKSGGINETYQIWVAQDGGTFRPVTKGAKSIDQLVAFCGQSGWVMTLKDVA